MSWLFLLISLGPPALVFFAFRPILKGKTALKTQGTMGEHHDFLRRQIRRCREGGMGYGRCEGGESGKSAAIVFQVHL